MKHQTNINYKYVIHLKAGKIIHLDGVPYELFGNADVCGNTNPEIFDEKLDFEEITDKLPKI
jgi:hypothetical protein